MKTIRDVMTPDVVWVYPSAKVNTAIGLMKWHNIGALPVVDNTEAICGWLDSQSLLGEDPDSVVKDVMRTDFATLGPDATVQEAAEAMTRSSTSHLLIVEDDRLIGIVSQSDLLPELGKSFDPLTGLPWSDALRNWSINALKWGMEISMILIDLNKFGAFNKQYGHVTGDNVLKGVSEVLKESVDTETDFVCRYGGDEFAIASVRMADDSLALGERLVKRIAEVEVPDLPEPVTATFGMSGGRRTREREDIHYAATLDDLINRASRNCTANKPRKIEEAPVVREVEKTEVSSSLALPWSAPIEGVTRLKVAGLSVSSFGPETTIEVQLTRGTHTFGHKVSGYTVAGRNAIRLAAEATAGAVSKSMDTGYGIVVDQVFTLEPIRDQQVVSVMAVFITPQHNISHVGSALVHRGDIYRAAVSALLSAVNRLVPTAPPSADRETLQQSVEDTGSI